MYGCLMVNSSDRLEKMGEIINNRKEYIKWLTVSMGELTMKSMVAECKIQCTARSKLNANRCVFISLSIKETECAIEVFANSSAIFNYFSFTNTERAALIIRDCSYAEFNYCSSVQLHGCKFMDCNKKRAFCNFTSFANIICCRFKNMKKGLLTITNKSECDILYSNIKGCGSTANRSIDSKLNSFFVTDDDVEGNIVNMENSTGPTQSLTQSPTESLTQSLPQSPTESLIQSLPQSSTESLTQSLTQSPTESPKQDELHIKKITNKKLVLGLSIGLSLLFTLIIITIVIIFVHKHKKRVKSEKEINDCTQYENSKNEEHNNPLFEYTFPRDPFEEKTFEEEEEDDDD